VISAVMAGVATLLAMSIWRLRCPVEVKVVSVEPSAMMSDDGKEIIRVTLSVSNRDSVSVMFDRVATLQAKVEDRWVEVKQVINLGRIAPDRISEKMLVMPGGAKACRLQLNYQSEIWKVRLMVSLGLTGRKLVAKSPWLCKWVWPDQWKTMRTPPRWKQITLEVLLPQLQLTAKGRLTAIGVGNKPEIPPEVEKAPER
jgi:hypothetical protein